LTNNNVKYYDNREYFLLHAWLSNDWVLAAYCVQCGCGFPVNNNEEEDDITFNVYKVKNDLYCEKDYFEIQLQHKKRGIDWGDYLYFQVVKESPDLK
jgi:hypothetical protein